MDGETRREGYQSHCRSRACTQRFASVAIDSRCLLPATLDWRPDLRPERTSRWIPGSTCDTLESCRQGADFQRKQERISMPKRTFQPNRRHRVKTHGFRARMKTKAAQPCSAAAAPSAASACRQRRLPRLSFPAVQPPFLFEPECAASCGRSGSSLSGHCHEHPSPNLPSLPAVSANRWRARACASTPTISAPMRPAASGNPHR